MNYKELYELVSGPYITIDGIASIAGCSRSSALTIVKAVEKEMDREGKMLPPSKKKLLPTEKVLKILGFDVNTIYNNASRLG